MIIEGQKEEIKEVKVEVKKVLKKEEKKVGEEAKKTTKEVHQLNKKKDYRKHVSSSRLTVPKTFDIM